MKGIIILKEDIRLSETLLQGYFFRAAKERIDAGFGIGPLKMQYILIFPKQYRNREKIRLKEKYGNLFDMYLKITGYDAYKEPMMISPSAHFSMGGLW